MTTVSVNRDEFVQQCEEVYERNKASLEKQYDSKVVALHEAGVAGIGDDVDAAYRTAVKRHPDKIFYFRRVGRFPAAGILF